MVMKLRAAIRSALPRDAAETISYGMPALKRDRVLVWYAAPNHCRLFPTAAVVQRFEDELADLKTSKARFSSRSISRC